MNRTLLAAILAALLTLALIAGCSSDSRVVSVSREAADRQARQNEVMAQQNKELVSASKGLVEADAQTRKEIAGMQKDLHTQQADIGRQRDLLEGDRKQVAVERKEVAVELKEAAKERRWDSQVAAALVSSGAILACVLPLVFAIYLLRAVRHETAADTEVVELLTHELVSPRSLLRPPPTALLPPAEEQSRGQIALENSPDTGDADDAT